MAEVTLNPVMHNGVTYDVDTPVTKIADLSPEQLQALRDNGAVGKPVVPESVKSELDAAKAEIELLKKQIADAAKTK